MFYKTASIPVVAVYQSSGKFHKLASKNAQVTKQEESFAKQALNLISKDVLRAVSKVYNISDDINDYIFPVPRAVAADIPNSNGDCFEHEELIRFSANHKCLVYQTFRNVPLHIEHAALDPKAARGFLPDAQYIQNDPKDRYVLTLVAMDASKDQPLAEGLLSGDIDSFSMGCVCDHVTCSHSKCNKKATNDKDLCVHLRSHKMRHYDGELIYEKCGGVEYQELSVVGDPAYTGATTQYILNKVANAKNVKEAKENFNLLSSMVSPQDKYEIARFFKENVGKLPESLLRLADKLF